MQHALEILEGRLESEADGERDNHPLLRLEEALHRREGLILVTSADSRVASALVRSALENAGESTTAITVSAKDAEPFSAIDRLLDAASPELAARFGDKHSAALDLIGRTALGGGVVVVVDHAQATTIAELERLRVALEIEAGRNRPVQLVVIGTRSFLARLKARDARGLWTRISTRIEVPDAAPMTGNVYGEEGMHTSKQPKTNRRGSLVTLTSAGILLAALLVIASLTSRGRNDAEIDKLATTVVAARAIGSNAAAPLPAAPQGPGAAPGQMVEPAAPGTPPILVPAPVTGPSPTAAPTGSATGDVATQAAESAGTAQMAPPRAEGSPRISKWMDVETVRGNARIDSRNAGPATEESAPDSAAAPKAAAAAAASLNDPKQPVAAPVRPDAARAVIDTKSSGPAAMGAGETAPSAVAATVAVPGRSGDGPAQPNASVTKGAQVVVVDETASASGPSASTASAAVQTGSQFDIQVAAFGKQSAATSLRDALLSEFPSTRIEQTVVAGAPFFRVRIGPIAASSEATRIEERLRVLGHQPVRYGGRKRSG